MHPHRHPALPPARHPAAPVPYGNPESGLPVPRFWQEASTGRKVAYVGGAAVGSFVLYKLVRWAARPVPLESVSDRCNQFKFGTQAEIDRAVRPLLRGSGAIDPFRVTSEFLNEFAAQCRTYPQTTENPGEAQLYIKSFSEVLRVMEEDQLVTPEQKRYFLEMVSVWGQSQGLAPDQVPVPMAPEMPLDVGV